MFNFFKEKQTVEVLPKRLTQQEQTAIVEKIHLDFFTEVDSLLIEAGLKENISQEEKKIKEKADTLKSLGFTSSISTELSEKVKQKEELNKEKETLFKAINYFSMKYPNYKFITRRSVTKLCQKWNLVLGDVSDFTGDVPDKNLEEIKNFSIDEKDSVLIQETNHTWGPMEYKLIAFIHPKDRQSYSSTTYVYYSEKNLSIVAPITDFNTRGKVVFNNELVQDRFSHSVNAQGFVNSVAFEDPIVLKTVSFENNFYYLIVSAWGAEASDELVVNHKFN